jgi:hypothetical protein
MRENKDTLGYGGKKIPSAKMLSVAVRYKATGNLLISVIVKNHS